MKKLIRWLYWKFGHNGDAWQHRLVVYHLRAVIGCEDGKTPGSTILGQINTLNGRLEPIAEVTTHAVTKEES